MALQLESLVFSVSTEALDEARIKISKLGDAVNSLNKPMQQMGVSSAKTAEAIAKSELAAEKARQATARLGQENARATPAVDSLEKLLTKLNNTYLDMGRGFSKGEASIINQARSLGALDDQLALVEAALKNIKELNKDPFDASLGGVRSITQEFERLTQRVNLAAQGINLTTKQLGEYSRLAAEARSKTAGEGLKVDSPEGQARMNQLLKEAQTEYLKTATSVNQLTNEEQQRLAILREQEKAQRLANSASIERAKLQDDLILREQKLAFVNKELAAGLTTASANALFKYQKDLQAVGETTDNITKRTAAFRAGLVEKQGHSPIKKIADDAKAAREQVDHLSRAIGVQLGDVAVSLAGGMNPFQVLIQQGDQLRFAVQNAKEEGKDLDLAMKNALKSIYTSFVDTGKVIGGFFVNAIVDSGKAITDFTVKAVGAESVMAGLAKRAPMLFAAVTTAIGAAAIGFGIFTAAGIIAFFQVEKQMKEFTRNLILTGGSLGMTTDSAISMAKSMNDLGISSSKAIEVMQSMAKEGGFVRSEIQMITQSAVDMQKWLGVSIDDTVKQFAKLKEDPVNALVEIAKKTGEVNSSILLAVESLRLQGRTADAAALAMKAYADATVQQVQRAKAEYTDFARVMIEIGSGLGKFWDGIKEMWIQAAPSVQLTREITRLNAMISSPGIGSDYKKQLENQRNELTKQLLLLDKVNLAEETNRQNQSESAKVFQQATATYEKYRGTVEKLNIDREQEINNQSKLKQQLRDGIISQQTYEYAVGASKLKVKKIDEDIAKERKKDNAEALSDAKKLADQRKKDMNVYEDIMNKSEGLNKAYNDSVDALSRSLKIGDITQQQYNAAFQALYEQQPGYIKQQQDVKKGVDDINKSTIDFNNKVLDSQSLIAKEANELSNLTATLGMTERQQKVYNIEYQKAVKLKELDIELEKDLKAIRDDKSIADNPYIQYDREQQIRKIYNTRRALVEAGANTQVDLLSDANLRLEKYGKSFEDIFSKMGDAIVDFALTGKWNFGDMVKSMTADLLRFEMRLQTSKLYESLGGISGITESITRSMGFNLAPVSDATIIPVAQAMGGAWDAGIQKFAKGGTFTNSVVSSPTLFKFAKGTGLMGEAGPEAIMPLTRSSDGSLGVRAEGTGSNVQVVINNSSGTPASASETVDSKGNRRIEVTIGEMATAEMSKSGSTAQNNIRSTFGLQPRLARR